MITFAAGSTKPKNKIRYGSAIQTPRKPNQQFATSIISPETIATSQNGMVYMMPKRSLFSDQTLPRNQYSSREYDTINILHCLPQTQWGNSGQEKSPAELLQNVEARLRIVYNELDATNIQAAFLNQQKVRLEMNVEHLKVERSLLRGPIKNELFNFFQSILKDWWAQILMENGGKSYGLTGSNESYTNVDKNYCHPSECYNFYKTNQCFIDRLTQW